MEIPRSSGVQLHVTSLPGARLGAPARAFVDWLAAALAFLMEPGEDKSLTWLILIQRFAYRQLMYWVVVRSFKAAFQGRGVGWGQLERKATVQLPVAS